MGTAYLFYLAMVHVLSTTNAIILRAISALYTVIHWGIWSTSGVNIAFRGYPVEVFEVYFPTYGCLIAPQSAVMHGMIR